VKQLAKVAHDGKKLITAAVFPTPAMARKICRQDWDKWPLDAVCPMIYNSFYNEPVSWIGDCVLEDVLGRHVLRLRRPLHARPRKTFRLRTGPPPRQKRGAAGAYLFGNISAANWAVFEKVISN
jgi:hypothetical protein